MVRLKADTTTRISRPIETIASWCRRGGDQQPAKAGLHDRSRRLKPALYMVRLKADTTGRKPDKARPICSDLAEGEGEFDGNEDRHRFAEACARHEAPLACGFDRFLIQTERRVERSHHFNPPHGAIG